jgi:hypothetical protein
MLVCTTRCFASIAALVTWLELCLSIVLPQLRVGPRTSTIARSTLRVSQSNLASFPGQQALSNLLSEMDFGMPMMNVNELIEMIGNDDIMFQYQGVMQLRELLTISDEKQLGGFPLDKACKRLIDILG